MRTLVIRRLTEAEEKAVGYATPECAFASASTDRSKLVGEWTDGNAVDEPVYLCPSHARDLLELGLVPTVMSAELVGAL